MRISEATALFDHLYWIRDRVLDAAEGLNAEDFLATDGIATRDLRATLVHELDVQWSWRLRLQGMDPAEWDALSDLEPEDYPDVGAVRDHWKRDEAEMRSWLASLSDADLDAPPAGADDRQPLWQYVMHLVSHGIQQFSEAAQLLTRAGRSPGDIGFLEFVDATGGREP